MSPLFCFSLKQSTRLCIGIAAVAFALGLGLAGVSAARTRAVIASTGVRSLKPAALWLRANSDPGDVVFTSNWDEFPELFFYNATNYYLVALDPTFMLAHDPDVFETWVALRSGERKDLFDQARNTFHARYVLITASFTALADLAHADPRLREVFVDKACAIFEVLP